MKKKELKLSKDAEKRQKVICRAVAMGASLAALVSGAGCQENTEVLTGAPAPEVETEIITMGEFEPEEAPEAPVEEAQPVLMGSLVMPKPEVPEDEEFVMGEIALPENQEKPAVKPKAENDAE